MTQPEAIIEAFKALGGIRNKSEIESWVSIDYGDIWKDFRVEEIMEFDSRNGIRKTSLMSLTQELTEKPKKPDSDIIPKSDLSILIISIYHDGGAFKAGL